MCKIRRNWLKKYKIGRLAVGCCVVCILGAAAGKSEVVYASGSGTAKIHFITFDMNTEGVLLESVDADGNRIFGMVDSGEDWDYPDGSDPRYPLRSGIITDKGYDEKVVEYLRSMGVNENNFYFYIGSHPHSDHIGTADTVIREFKPQTLYLMPYEDSYIDTSNGDTALWDNQYVYDQTIEAAEETGINIVQDINAQNSKISLGSFQIQIVNYDPSYQTQKNRDANDFCLGVIASANQHTAFLTGDMCNVDGDMTRTVNEYPILQNTAVYEANHHGLSDSDVGKIASMIHPQYLIQPGSFTNLTTSWLAMLENEGTKVFAVSSFTDQTSIVVDFTGQQVTSSVDGAFRIYKDRDGKLRAYDDGRQYSGFFENNGAKYYAGKEGIIAVNQEVYDENENIFYHADEEGRLTPVGGWVEEDGNKYYLNADGTRKKGWAKIAGATYYFDPGTGVMMTGWVQDSSGWYLLDSETGVMQTGWCTDGSNRFYLDPETGVMQKNCWIKDEETGIVYWLREWGAVAYSQTLKIDGYSISFDSQGKTAGGAWAKKEGKWSYLQNGIMQTGWQKIGIDWYYFNQDGSMKSDELFQVDGNLYYFRSWGAMQYNNWYQNPADGNWYYLRSWGAAVNYGWMQVENNWYYFNDDCTMKKNELCWIEGNLYYFRGWGAMQYNNWYQNPADGNWYYLRSWGAAVNYGWIHLDRDWYYFNGDCTMKKDELCWINGDLYYFRSWGARQYNNWYQNPSDGKWYLFASDGKAYRNCRARNGIDTYYFNDDGSMYTGWKEENGKTYYYRNWGAMAYSMTLTIDGVPCTFNFKGELVKKG